jgi:ubiquinone/menaquinone biosynthesis C-methylase UbiE
MNDTIKLISNYQQEFGKVIVDLGCGPNKKAGMIGIDVLPLPGVDIIANLEEGFPAIPDNSIDEFHTTHFLEHVNNFELLMAEMHRTLKPGGLAKITVPHFSNPYYYSDYTHKRFFGLYSFDYFSSKPTGYKRTIPVYNDKFSYTVISRKLVFKSPTFFVRNLIKKHFWTRLFNSGKLFQSFYEDACTGIIPCYEVVFLLSPDKK